MMRIASRIDNLLRGLVALQFRSTAEKNPIAAICESLMFHPEEWDVGRESLLHSQSGLELDFGLGLLLIRFSATSRVRFNLNFSERILLWRAIRRFVRQTFANDLKLLENT